jgi:hypothetical protein
MSSGSAQITIKRLPNDVWAAIADVTRMGDWSPECVAGRWVGDATGPAVGARFEGDNVAKVAGRTVKRWTTTAEVTACDPGVVFEFLVENQTTWRYEFRGDATGATIVTESFSYTGKGFMGFVYDRILLRPKAMTKGMHSTLARVKSALETA